MMKCTVSIFVFRRPKNQKRQWKIQKTPKSIFCVPSAAVHFEQNVSNNTAIIIILYYTTISKVFSKCETAKQGGCKQNGYTPELVACGTGPTASDELPLVSSSGPWARRGSPLLTVAGFPIKAALFEGAQGSDRFLNLDGELEG